MFATIAQLFATIRKILTAVDNVADTAVILTEVGKETASAYADEVRNNRAVAFAAMQKSKPAAIKAIAATAP